MKLSTKNCISIMRVINSMGVKKDLISLMKKAGSLEKEKESIILGLKKGEEVLTPQLVIELLGKNPKIAQKYNSINADMEEIGLELLFLILEGVPRAEEDFYKVLADIKGTDLETEKGVDGDENVGFIKEIITSETFKNFFTLLMK